MNNDRLTIHRGDCRDILPKIPAESVQCVVTSPPYWGLRDYGHEEQIGLEKTPQEYVEKLAEIFRELRRVLKDDGTLWLNLGDTYAKRGGPGWQGKNGERADRRFVKGRGSVPLRDTGRKPPEGFKAKDLIGIPWRVAFALQEDGWFLRSDIIWSKPNPTPYSGKDRPTTSHEHIFLLAKSANYFYDIDAIREPYHFSTLKRGKSIVNTSQNTKGEQHRNRRGAGEPLSDEEIEKGRNKRSVWTVATSPYREAHFATYPKELIKPCILAGSRPGDMVLDPFGGSGTTGLVALELGRNATLIEINDEYAELIEHRTNITPGLGLD